MEVFTIRMTSEFIVMMVHFINFHTKIAYLEIFTPHTPKKLKALDISATLFDNVAFVFLHAMETFSKDLLEVHELKSRGFQLLLHELQQRCAQNFD